MSSTDTRLYGDVGESTDSLFLINGNAPGQVKLVEARAELQLHTLSGQRVSVAGEFTGEDPHDPLQSFVVHGVTTHCQIAERAYELSQQSSAPPEQNWLRAETELLAG
jgi:hypothetical protein